MSSSESSNHVDVLARLCALHERIEALEQEAGAQGLPAGTTEVLRGLGMMIKEIEEGEPPGREDQGRLDALIQGLGATVAFVLGEAAQPVVPERQGLGQFIDAFCGELVRRLSGLSVGLMSALNQQTKTGAELSNCASHLHAIRGGAAMLTLAEVVHVSEVMEHIILAMARAPHHDHSTLCAQPLMVGFRALESAARSREASMPEQEYEHAMGVLRACFDQLLLNTTLSDLGETSEAAVIDRSAKVYRDTSDEELERVGHVGPLEQRLLIVDDMETIAASVGFVLSDLDLPMDIALDGAEALQMLRAQPYSLVISDIAMPRIDGIALTRMIRADEHLRGIPVVLLTALDHPIERDTGFDAGANDYIIKGSIGGGELVRRVRELLKIAPFVPAPRPAGYAAPASARKRVLVAEDAETVAASIAFVLAQGNYEIVLAGNGHEALTRLEREPFDLLMTDWQMPAMSGVELTRAVRLSSLVADDLPIVFLTSVEDEALRQEAMDAGADCYFIKGEIGGGKLFDMVESLIHKG